MNAGWSGGLGRHPAPGDMLGKYHLQKVLGAGGMATVYRAVDPQRAAVAVKVLNPARVMPEDVKRFTREFRALSRMDHPNVVHVYEAGVHDGYPWIAMELVEGHDLDTELAAWKQADPGDRWERVGRILRGTLQGLGYIHDLGLVHRDLKPSNILLSADGEPKITDFGVVKTDNTHSTQLTMAGRLVGTVAFMAPELITDEGVDRRTDLYALGAVLYLMCTFQRPIEADSVAGYLARHLTEVPRPVGELEPRTPAILERVCARLLQKDRQYRYPSANAVLQALDRPEDPELPPLRGREEVQTALSRRMMAAQEGAGAVLGLVGPEGSGKTHLLRTLVEHAPALRVAFARCVPGGVSLLDQLDRALPGERTTRGWDRLLQLAREPLVVAIDDLDCDPAWAAELGPFVRRAIALEARPLLVVFTATSLPDPLQAFVAGDTTGVPCETFPLLPLDAKATLALLRDRHVGGPVLQVLARRLHGEFGGLPGGMVDQLQALVDRGWLRPEADQQLRPTRPLDDFRKGELPVPDHTRDRVLDQLDDLEAGAREVCELLAVLGRPASAALLERARPGRTDTGRFVDLLVDEGLLIRQRTEEQEAVSWRDPGAARVVRAELGPDRRKVLHAAVADALGAKKRRAHNALEIATHLEAAGDDLQALPLYVQAARRVAREGRPVEVLDICEAGERTAARTVSTDAREVDRQRLWLLVLRGEALLARRAWDQAVDPLEKAALLADREADRTAQTRARAALGRVHYRAGRFASAEPLLREALAHADEGAPERSSALRALADVALRAGRIDESRALWTQARELAEAMGSKDAVARSRRGLAHVAAIEGHLEEASSLLRQAEDLLLPDGDVRVRTSVLARAAEIDCALGHTASALFRARTLVELLRQHGLSERLPEAYVLVAEILTQVGDVTEALDAAHQCVVYSKAAAHVPPFIRLRVARVFCDLQRLDQARQALPSLEELEASPVGDGLAEVLHDPAAQLAAVRARVHAREHPVRARDLATWALTRRPPRMVLHAARIAIDSARALLELGQPMPARTAVKHGLKVIGPTHDGLRLELLLTMQSASPDPRILEAIATVARRMLPGLPPEARDGFDGRLHVGEALRWRDATPDSVER